MTIMGGTVCDTQSPFSIMLLGVWVPLAGVAPGWSRSPSRPSSEFTTLGGNRHVQVAQKVSRDWSLNFQHATPEALSALAVAVEQDATWFHDFTAARANMLDPRVTHGLVAGTVLMVDGVMPLWTLPDDFTFEHEVRKDVEAEFSFWTSATAATTVVTLSGAEIATLVAPAGTGVRRENHVFTPTINGSLTVTIESPLVTGLQLVEHMPSPPMWMAGQRTPCMVSVTDADRAQGLVMRGFCGDWGLSRDEWNVVVREVG